MSLDSLSSLNRVFTVFAKLQPLLGNRCYNLKFLSTLKYMLWNVREFARHLKPTLSRVDKSQIALINSNIIYVLLSLIIHIRRKKLYYTKITSYFDKVKASLWEYGLIRKLIFTHHDLVTSKKYFLIE
jgi:hypothetical protein